MTLLQVSQAAEVCAAVSGIALARRRKEHAPAAVALALLAAVTLLEVPILAALAPMPRPIEGPARALVYLDGAINLATIAATTGLAVAVAAVSARQRRRAVAIVGAVWLLASIALAALYPSPVVRGAGLQRIYLAADLFGLFVSTVALIGWARRGIAAKRSPDGAPLVAIGLVLLDVAVLVTPLSPWRGSVFGASFDGVQVEILIVFAALTAAQVIAWRYSSTQ